MFSIKLEFKSEIEFLFKSYREEPYKLLLNLSFFAYFISLFNSILIGFNIVPYEGHFSELLLNIILIVIPIIIGLVFFLFYCINSNNDRFKNFLLFLIIILNITIWNFYFLNYFADDTFISLRYSLNFSKGYGLVYNVDNAPFEGYSNFLFVIIMIVPFLVTNDLYFIIYFVKSFGLLFCFGSVILMYLIMIELKTDKKYHLIPSLIFSIIPNFTYWGISGLETSFYSFFLLLSVLFLIKSNFNKISSGYLLLSLFILSLIRIDGIVISLSILLVDFFSKLIDKKISKQYLKNIITHFSLPYLLYTIFRIGYFNSFFPLPFLAKSGSINSIFSSIQSNLIIFFYLFPFFILLLFFNEKNTVNKKVISYLYIIFLITLGLGFIVKISLDY